MIKELKMAAMAASVLALGTTMVSGAAFSNPIGLVGEGITARAVVVEGPDDDDFDHTEDEAVSTLQTQITAALSDTTLTSEQLAAKIAGIVSGAADPEAAAKLVISSASGSSAAVQSAVGNGLGKAAKDIGVNNPAAGTAISTAVSTSGSTNMKTAYTTTTQTTGSTSGTPTGQQNGQPVPKKTTTQNSDTTGSPT